MRSMKTGFGAIFFTLALFMVLIPVLPDLIEASEDSRTDPVTETGVGCTTGVGETTCDVVLASAHGFNDTTAMSVVETSPSSVIRTSQTTVGADAQTLTIAGLTGSTSYVFTVDYVELAPGLNSTADLFLRGLGLWVVIGVVTLAGALILARRFV